MDKILLYLFVIHVIPLVACSVVREIAEEVIPFPILSFILDRKEDIINAWKDGVEGAKKLMDDPIIPISETPLYSTRAEDKIYNKNELMRYGGEFKGATIMPGTSLQNLAQFYGFYDMIDVKHVLCEFFYNSVEIMFYRGTANFSVEILKRVEKLGVLEDTDIKPLTTLGFDKKGQSLPYWYYSDKYEKFVPLMGDLLGFGKGYGILSKEKVAIKKKYYKLTDEIAELLWHSFFLYQEEYAPRENIVHQMLKRDQIRGHLMGNAFSLSMLNDTVKFRGVRNIYLGQDELDTGKLKKEIKSFITKIGAIYTNGEVDLFKEESFIHKIVQYILRKLGLVTVLKDVVDLYKFKIEVLVILTKILDRADLDKEKAMEIIELCINNWKTVFFLHVSGTLTSTKPAPEFYNHHETIEEKDSGLTSDSDTVENEKLGSNHFENFEITDNGEPNNWQDHIGDDFESTIKLEDVSELGEESLEEKDKIAKLLEDKNPFRDLFQRSLLLVDLNMKKIRQELVYCFESICKQLLLSIKECSFINHAIKNINTYVLEKDGRIASRKYCNKYAAECRRVGTKTYSMFIRKMTEIQGVSMGIIEFLILQCEKNESLKGVTIQEKKQLKNNLIDLFKRYYVLRIFVTKEYKKALINYARGKKNSKIVQLAEERVKQINKGIGLIPKKPLNLNPLDMDPVLIPDNSKD